MPGIPPSQEEQIRNMLAAGNKIAAVKLYREMTGASLAEAKQAMEMMQFGEFVPTATAQPVGEPDPFLENQIKRLLEERKKIEAVRVYREAYHCGLKEAKDAVDLIEAEMRREGYSNMSVTPAINNDPFAENAQRNRRYLVLAIALLILLLSGLAFFLLIGNGF